MDDSKTPPFYIVGLPDEPLEAAQAKMKFERLSNELSRAFPFIEELRAVVKSKKAFRDARALRSHGGGVHSARQACFL
ncbi:MAG: hypothetical protein LYZ66_02785 [Nitrososphaerales archaeon]|nr:hypothetical protein [Nitrososphaerales archaeon]